MAGFKLVDGHRSLYIGDPTGRFPGRLLVQLESKDEECGLEVLGVMISKQTVIELQKAIADWLELEDRRDAAACGTLYSLSFDPR